MEMKIVSWRGVEEISHVSDEDFTQGNISCITIIEILYEIIFH